VAEFSFVPNCLAEIRQIEAACSPHEATILEEALARVATDPALPVGFPHSMILPFRHSSTVLIPL
jgi:hypothetical protein